MLLYLIMALLISFSIDRSLRSQALQTKLLTVKRAEFEVSLILYDKLLMMLMMLHGWHPDAIHFVLIPRLDSWL